MTQTTDFGYQRVPVGEKGAKVNQVFSSVASRYDLMNDLMSGGMHRLWKRFALMVAAVRDGDRVLDLAGGTGDLTAKMIQRVGERGSVILSDYNADMLAVGRDRMINRGFVDRLDFVQADAQALPFRDNTFDVVTMAFGLRNVTDKSQALRSIQRVLCPGGRLMVLEFSHVVLPLLKHIYDGYSFNVIPRLGELVAGDRASYQYLVESIREFPDQQTLLGMMTEAGLERCAYNNLTGGIVAVHHGYKF